MPDDDAPEQDAPAAGDAPEAPAAGEPAVEEAPVIAPQHEELLARLQADLGDGIVEAVSNHGDLVVRVRNEAWHQAGEVARNRLDCDYLSFVSAIDWAPRPDPPSWNPDVPTSPVQPKEITFGAAGGEGRFQVLACVESPNDHTQVVFKTDAGEESPRVASWTDLYPGADWHERECWEMFGITFDGHPHLRHIYLPSEFEGHPLRKDFPLLSRELKPWPGLVDVEAMPGADEEPADAAAGGESE